jgi:hypothetical protein
MSHVAIIVGIAGGERYLAHGKETIEAKQARKFRSEKAAEQAARDHIRAHPPFIQRLMKYQVRPA